MYLKEENTMWIAAGNERIHMLPKMANRHGLVAGATGTGKTVTIKVLAETFSDMGVPVFMADVKGDVSGLCRPGEPNNNVDERVRTMGISDFSFGAYPVRFFDVYGKKGIPARTTISNMGPNLIARILGLNETQTGVLQIVFRVADDSGILLLDLKDLRAMVRHTGENAKEYTIQYGSVSTQTIGAIQRGLLTLESSGGDIFFGEPSLELRDWLAWDDTGRGMINILDCVTLFQSPMLYSTFLLWMLSDLYEMMPEVGDLDKPRMVFFFDEAHLLFTETPKILLQKIEQMVRLIRSKGVGVYFITQSPSDIPDTVLAQLGNTIQHALRAYTPKEQRALKAAAAAFRPNPDFKTETVLGELSTGEALLSLLDEKGAPRMVQRGFILPPRSFMGVAGPDLVERLTRESPLYSKYYQPIDRYSAYEHFQQQAQIEQQKKEQEAQDAQRLKESRQQAKPAPTQAPRSKSNGPLDRAISSAMSQAGRSLTRELIRGFMGNKKR
ncbi:MAG: DUF853 domain-containing protein [Peptococcaceae bacterium]|jgi:DNA helicase HerA-like ATPase|nr:DUF853 domain-containing protein [Peptococcaceae bacterium]